MKIGKNTRLAKEALEAGALVAIPTETVYGLAANALDSKATAKIFEAKKRPHFNPLIVHIGKVADLEPLIQSKPAYVDSLIKKFWPGPLTLVFPKSNSVPDILTGGLDTVAVRIPNHALTLELLSKLDFPLAAPSANPFKYISPTTAQHVADQMKDKVAYILDGGKCEVGIESTIIKCEEEQLTLLREGKILKGEIEKLVALPVKKAEKEAKKEAPGMLSKHYSPGKKMVIGNIRQLISQYPGQKIGILSFKNHFSSNSIFCMEVLSQNGDLLEAAAQLFTALRKLDQSNADIILAEYVPDIGIGNAINDRLERAAEEPS